MQSIMATERGTCYLCKKYGLYAQKDTELYHIFGGGSRRACNDDGVTIYLCRRHRRLCHEGSQSPMLRFKLHQEGQRKWLEHYGPDLVKAGKDPTEEFMKRYGRNYL